MKLDFTRLHERPATELEKLGFRRWNNPAKPDPGDECFEGKVLWLIPDELFDQIPEGLEVISITGRKRTFHAKMDRDTRWGLLAFGILVPSADP